MAYLLLHNFKDAFMRPGISRAEKAEARKTLWGLMVSHTLMTGTLGLPVAFPLGMLAKLFAFVLGSSAIGIDFDPEDEWRNYLTDIFGPDVARAIAKGLPAAMGIDLSKKLGVGDVFDPFAYMRPTEGGGRGWIAEGLLTMAGPSAGVLADGAEGINLMAQGKLAKGAEKMMPKAIADVMKAVRYSKEGMTTTRENVTLKSGDFGIGTLVAQATGIPTTYLTDYYQGKAAVEGAVAAVADRRNKLIDAAVKARADGDDDARESAQERIDKFNAGLAEVGDRGSRITASTVFKALQAKRRYERETTPEGIRADKRRRPYLPLARFEQDEAN
jgi:hypothetical protein